ncbi:PIR protein [Plasmodium yoelii]|uniref:PIR protein n=3 Tax=Plasmodium yoelii TaxID=5861 RepID=A0AAF0AZ56_PLAYO|nr:PIR protein [Plasmodium yoelii]WBY56172.1 PIR protein [Plasmodium yoelii yoelii]VTZ76100.1 PIR protein [Plasmodium yoelii]|eukprot:XP_022811060.2 PIR protein [Plasmodium yoelii]
MNKQVCEQFQEVRNSLPDQLDSSGNYQFKNEDFLNKYCDSKNCISDYDKISAVCLYLFDAFFGSLELFNYVVKRNTNIVDYILIWLSYMLNLTKIGNDNSINPFYNQYIYNGEKYNEKIKNVTDYENYLELIEKNHDLMNINDMHKFYEPFKILCNMYIEFNKQGTNCENYLKDAKKFVEKYDELNEDYNNGKDTSYNQLLSTLSNDYCNLKNKCNQFPTLPTYSRRFVIKRTLIPIAFMIVALSIFLGIEYKYSSLGVRKRSQKQCLREKIKNIMKKMIH